MYKSEQAAPTPTNKKDADYLRFRPYCAFTAHQPKTNHWALAQRIALIMGFLALLLFSGKFLLYAIT